MVDVMERPTESPPSGDGLGFRRRRIAVGAVVLVAVGVGFALWSHFLDLDAELDFGMLHHSRSIDPTEPQASVRSEDGDGEFVYTYEPGAHFAFGYTIT